MKQLHIRISNKYAIAALILLVMFISFLLTDVAGRDTVITSGIIIEKLYKPEKIYVSKISEIDRQNHSFNYLIAESEPAERILFVKSESGKVIRMSCQAETFYSKDVGDSIPYSEMHGHLTNWSYFGIGIFKPVHTARMYHVSLGLADNN